MKTASLISKAYSLQKQIVPDDQGMKKIKFQTQDRKSKYYYLI